MVLKSMITIRTIVDPEAAAGSPTKQSRNKQCSAAQRKRGYSHGGELSGAKVHRRILRSSSAHTAPTIEKVGNRPTHIERKTIPPLSQSYVRHSGNSRRRVSGSTLSPLSTLSKSLDENQNSLSYPMERVNRRPSDYPYTFTSLARCRTSILLSQARRSAEQSVDCLGRKPSIMDVILDLKSSLLECDEDTSIDAAQRSREPHPHRQYTFIDEQSLATYLADQPAVWSDMRMIEGMSCRFPDSGERSTVFWPPGLNERRSKD